MKKNKHNRYLPILKNSGQAVVESILLMSILFGVFVFVAGEFKKRKLVSKLISKPWKKIDNVIRYGDIGKNPVHPNSIDKHQSLVP
ncbi:MAG: hypothetical protein HAW60_01005 [Bdellovibrionales bacterium]|nr:hypothetical protein [Bdellovibrionales bacterium]